MADRFTKRTVQEIAKRAGYRCSAPFCGAGTTRPDPADAEIGRVLGEAAHITAASPGGPRYDPGLSAEQRHSAANGIWMCTHHAILIDKMPESFPADILRLWKTQAEARAARETEVTPDRRAALLASVDEAVAATADFAHRFRATTWDCEDTAASLQRVQDDMVANQAYYGKHVVPLVSEVLTSAAAALGAGDPAVEAVASAIDYAATNVLSVLKLERDLATLRGALAAY